MAEFLCHATTHYVLEKKSLQKREKICSRLPPIAPCISLRLLLPTAQTLVKASMHFSMTHRPLHHTASVHS